MDIGLSVVLPYDLHCLWGTDHPGSLVLLSVGQFSLIGNTWLWPLGTGNCGMGLYQRLLGVSELLSWGRGRERDRAQV